jgi:hypothetical protein
MIVTVEELKIYAGIDTSDDDAGLELILKGVIGWAESICDNAMEQKEFIEYFDGESRALFMKNTLNISDVVVEWFSSSGWEILDPDTKLRIFVEEGCVILREAVFGELNYKVTYKAGYNTAVPSDLKLIVLKMASKVWNKRKSDGIKDEKLGDAQVIWENFLTDDILGILQKYRKFNI